MILFIRAVIALAAVVALPAATLAVPLYDFGDLNAGGVTYLGASAALPGGITGSAYYYDGTTWQASVLTARDDDDDHGLGVCSEGTTSCNEGGGDYNELSQLLNNEAILLEKPTGFSWDGLWVSSLDENGTGNAEAGTLHWGYSNEVDALLGAPSFNFAYGVFGTNVEGELTLPGTFDINAPYLLFVPNGVKGENNDYLVWGADLISAPTDVPVPEPASLVLLGSGLIALALKRRRSS